MLPACITPSAFFAKGVLIGRAVTKKRGGIKTTVQVGQYGKKFNSSLVKRPNIIPGGIANTGNANAAINCTYLYARLLF
jgi:hypothetical protein